MMMGPTKKKVFTAGFVCFLIPVILGTLFFFKYKKDTEATIQQLQEKGKTVQGYVLAKSMAAGEIITPEDITLAEVKAETVPADSFPADDENIPDGEKVNFNQIVNRRLIISAEANTIITKSMLFDEADPAPSKDIRRQEFNMLTLPSDLTSGEYIDIRLAMPSGEDYIVISGKEVKDIGNGPDTNTIFLELDEEEIIRTTAAIIESYMMKGTDIYVNKYVKPSVQLFNSKRVDLEKLYHDTYAEIEAEKEALLSGEGLTSGDSNEPITADNLPIDGMVMTPSGAVTLKNGKVVVTNAQVAARIGVDEKVINSLLDAIEKKDDKVLASYKTWLLKTPTPMENTYPVKPNVAEFIKRNPNILKDLSEKYDIEKLEAERANIPEIPLFDITVDYENNRVVYEASESLNHIDEEIKKKIEEQRTERKDYLQALLLNASTEEQ